MPSSRAFILPLFLLSTLALAQHESRVATTAAQQPSSPSITTDQPGGLIHLDAVVTDASGFPVSGLSENDFTLQDHGQPARILSFHASDGSSRISAHARLILVIDVIDLMYHGIPTEIARDEKVAAERYLRKNGGHLTRPVSVYLVDDRGLWTVVHSAGDGNTMADDIVHNRLKMIRPFAERPSTTEINGPVPPQDSPAMSTLKSIGQIATGERRRQGRKALIWVGPTWSIGPGLYNLQRNKANPLPTRVWFSTLLREARIAFYSFAVAEHDPRIGVLVGDDGNSAELTPPKDTYMSWDRKRLAAESGGLAMDASYDLVQQIEKCARDADTFYTLTFDPTHADAPNEYHNLKVLVNKPGLVARTNAGYYNQPWYAVHQNATERSTTVKQLKQMLSANHSASDAELAERLASLEMSERLNNTEVADLLATARGKRTREALKILADASVFLDPPTDDIPADAMPGLDAQHHMLSLTAEYLSSTIHRLPNYLAHQTTVRYQETPQLVNGSIDNWVQPLHVTDTLSVSLHYHAGSEIAETIGRRTHKERADDPQLDTYGTFGPVLAGLNDALQRHTDMTWKGWEKGPSGLLAVFRYVIPAESSRYQARACCLPDGDGKSAFLHYVGYHGEVAIDPENGTVVRLEWSADLKSTTPVAESRIMVEYAPVEIGGTKYVCPVRSISMMRARSVADTSQWDESFLTYGPYATMLNETDFSNYRVFRSTSRMLPEFRPVDNQK